MKPAFFHVPRHEVTTSEGPVTMPILYYDVSLFQAFFSVAPVAAEAVLHGTGLRPVLVGGKALAGVAMFEYRHTSIGPYNEVGVVVAAYREEDGAQPAALRDFLLPSAKRKIGFRVLDLPVSTAAACAAGRELWGFPKFITDMPLTFSGRDFSGTVMEPESQHEILTLDGSHGRGLTLPGIDLVLYSELENQMLRTVVDVDSKMVTASGRGFMLTVGNSTHRMAENLRTLDLHGKKPLMIQNARYFRSRLPLGQPIGQPVEV